MHKSIKRFNKDVSTDENKRFMIESRNVHQQNCRTSNKSNWLEFMKLSKENSVKNPIWQTSHIVAKLGWFLLTN